MRKTLLGILLILSIENISNAQIKVVGDDYKDSLSGAKNYYDRDIDFNFFFPQLSPLEHRHQIGARLSQNLYENMTGDTVYIPVDIETKYFLSKSTNAGQSFFDVEEIPKGYYVIQGYVFCKENVEKLGLGTGRHSNSIKELKERILEFEGDYSNNRWLIEDYLERIIIRSVDNSDILYSFNPNLDLVYCLRFYNELKEHFVGKRVHLYKYPDYNTWDNKLMIIPLGSIEKDDLREESIKMMDDEFVVNDVIFKDEDFYLVMKGEKTGSFAKNIDLIKSSYKFYPPENTVFFSSDILCARTPRYSTYIMTDSDYKLLQKKYAELKTKKTIKQGLQDQQRKLTQEKEKAEFRKKMIAKYGTEKGALIGNRQITIDMTKEMCKDAWGTPINTYRTTTSYGQSEVWCYNYKTRVYFYNGKVVQIDD